MLLGISAIFFIFLFWSGDMRLMSTVSRATLLDRIVGRGQDKEGSLVHLQFIKIDAGAFHGCHWVGRASVLKNNLAGSADWRLALDSI